MAYISTSHERVSQTLSSSETTEQETERMVAATHREPVVRLVYMEKGEGKTVPQIILKLIALNYAVVIMEHEPKRKVDGAVQSWVIDFTVKEKSRGVRDASANIETFNCTIDARDEYEELRSHFASLFSAVHSPRR
jgi:hypothetical protein